MFSALANCEMAIVLVKPGPVAHSTEDLLAPRRNHDGIHDPRELTRGDTEMGTGDKDAADTENSRHNDEPHGPFPIAREFCEPIEQLAKEEQEGHLDGIDGDPADNLGGEGQLLVLEDTVFKPCRHGLLQH